MLACFLVSCFIVAFGFIMIFFISYESDQDQLSCLSSARLTFSSFLKLYQANPSLWDFSLFTAKYQDFFIDFSFIDYIRYRFWLSKKEKQEEKKRKLNNTESFINSYRQDLARQQEEEIKQLEEKIKRLSQSPSLTLTKTPEPIEDTREKVIIKYTGKLPE